MCENSLPGHCFGFRRNQFLWISNSKLFYAIEFRDDWMYRLVMRDRNTHILILEIYIIQLGFENYLLYMIELGLETSSIVFEIGVLHIKC